MDFNKLIEEEINKRIETKLRTEVDNKLISIKNNLKVLLINRIDSAIEEAFRFPKKCEYESCKNYGDGTIDSICENCDSRLIKIDKDNKAEENLKKSNNYENKNDNSASYNKTYQTYVANLNSNDKIKLEKLNIKDKELKSLIEKLLKSIGY